MPSIYTPLRYPGGKAKLGPFLVLLLKTNRLVDGIYAEPYAGGAGAALFLLFRGYVSRIHLNDLDQGVASFWRAVVGQNERFAREIETIPLTVEEWDRQRQAFDTMRPGFEKGFSFFYLNRTNRSGIMNGGIIGGRSQNGTWRIDARFNRNDLAERVRAIGRIKRLISLSNSDAMDFLDEFKTLNVSRRLVYLDPPYFKKGRDLYTNFYTDEDHATIANKLERLDIPWLLTYDDCCEIRNLYERYQILESELSYSAREVRRGRELVIFGGGLKPPIPTSKHTRHQPGFKLLAEARLPDI
jgi:DNA adenine methylase